MESFEQTFHPIILATILNESSIKFEQERNIFPNKVLDEIAMLVYSETNGNDLFGLNNSRSEENHSFNFKGGPIASHVANIIMAKQTKKRLKKGTRL